MSEPYGCEQVTSLAPELALGTAVGEERAAALEHLASCATCRRLIAELAALTDEIIALAPAAEPPAGFETRVLERFIERRKRRHWTVLALAAAFGALAMAIALLVAFDDERDIASHYREALDVAHGEYFGVRPLLSNDGMQEGYLFLYEGAPSWVFVTLDDSDPGPHAVEAEMRDGDSADLGSFELADGKRSWGTTVTIELADVKLLRVTDDADDDILTARVAREK